MALAATLTFFSRPQTEWEFYALCGLLFVSLFYGLSGWVTKPGLGSAGKIGRTIALLIVVSVAVGLYGWHFRPGWHLTSSQKDGLAEAAKHIPKNIIILVELPENSIAGQGYGKDIMEVLKDNGVQVNAITIFYGVGETPVGLVVSARFPSDPAYQAAGYMHSKMLLLQMPAKFQEGNTITADAMSFIIYVGSKPVE